MSAPHRIRLHGPWVFEVFDVDATTGDVAVVNRGRFQMPDGWADALGEESGGVVRLSRRFNSPTGLGAHNRVWLVVEGIEQLGSVRLNDRALEQIAANDESSEDLNAATRIIAFDVSERLSDHNLLTLELDRTTPTGSPVAGVRLEIRES